MILCMIAFDYDIYFFDTKELRDKFNKKNKLI